jgi:hypothetical protein
MKQTVIVILFITCFFSAAFTAGTDTVAAQAALTATAKPAIQTIPVQVSSSAAAAQADNPAELTQPAVYHDDNTFSVQQKLLLAGDICSISFCAVQWVNFLQELSNYNEAYDRYNNTSYSNYQMLLRSRTDLLNRQNITWISTGAAAAFLFYTAADIIWIHAVFPVAPGLAYRNNQQILTLNYRF